MISPFARRCASGHRDDAGEGQPAALADGRIRRADQQVAVLVHAAEVAPGRPRPGLPGPEQDHVAVAAPRRTSGTPSAAREHRMLVQVQRLAVDRHGDLRPHPADTSAPVRHGADGPETCTRCVRSVITSTPCRIRLLMMRPTAFSLPGMVRDDRMTRSPGASATSGCWSSATRASAARGSPWLPVSSATTLSRGR